MIMQGFFESTDWKLALKTQGLGCKIIYQRYLWKRTSMVSERATMTDTVLVLWKNCLVWGVPNYLSCYPPGETDETMTRHQEKLSQQNQLPYEKQDSILIKKIMDTTFSHERKMIVTQLVKIADLAIQYPILCNEDQVSCII